MQNDFLVIFDIALIFTGAIAFLPEKTSDQLLRGVERVNAISPEETLEPFSRILKAGAGADSETDHGKPKSPKASE